MSAHDLVVTDEQTTLSIQRRNVALESTWEIENLTGMLRNSAQPDHGEIFYLIRGVTARIEELNGIIMGALDDDLAQTQDLAYRLRLKRDEGAA